MITLTEWNILKKVRAPSIFFNWPYEFGAKFIFNLAAICFIRYNQPILGQDICVNLQAYKFQDCWIQTLGIVFGLTWVCKKIKNQTVEINYLSNGLSYHDSINSNRSMRLINNSNSISLKSYSSRSNLFFTWQVKVLELKVQ